MLSSLSLDCHNPTAPSQYVKEIIEVIKEDIYLVDEARPTAPLPFLPCFLVS